MRFLILIIASFALFANTANAATISFNPTAPTTLGSSVNIDLVISGLGNGVAPSLGAFAVDIAYDNAIIGFNSVTYSDFLGTAGIDSSFFTTSVAGLLTLDNFSFLSSATLDTLQGASFTLATVSFNSLSVGTSTLAITPLDISDALGNSLTVGTQTIDGSVQVINATTPVPAPSILLLLIPVLGLFGMKKVRFA